MLTGDRPGTGRLPSWAPVAGRVARSPRGAPGLGHGINARPANLTALGATRFDLKYGMGGLAQRALMTNIELYGTRVIPRVRESSRASASHPARPRAFGVNPGRE
jgi:hypothetical protein